MKKELLTKIFPIIIAVLFINYCKPTSNEITTEDLKYYVRILSDDSMGGRESGRISGKKSADFIIEKYKENGFKPEIHEFTFNTGPEDTGSKLISGNEKLEGTAIPFSGPSEVTGKLFDGGFCLANKQKQIKLKFEVKNKIVVCNRYGPKGKEAHDSKEIAFVSKYKMLMQAGAKGIIFLDGNANQIHPSMFRPIDKNGPPAIFLSQSHYKSIDSISNNDVTIITSYVESEATGRNIVVSLKPEIEKKSDTKTIYIGGHYDHLGSGIPGTMEGYGKIHNGADDNASGTAVILELMQYLKANPKLIPDPYNIIAVHFDAEERGLIGAGKFIKSDFYIPGIAMINLDMVGRLRESRGIMVQGADTADESWKKLIIKAHQESIGQSAELRLTRGGSGPSDHSKFYAQKTPVAFIFTGSHSNYHRSSDDYSTLNYEGMEQITRFSLGIIKGLTDSKEAPVFQLAKEEASRKDFDFKVRLGIVPGSYGEDGGILVNGFAKNAPIATSGIQIGDRIVQIGDFEIQNIHSLMNFLEDARTDVPYKIIALREKRKIIVKSKMMSSD